MSLVATLRLDTRAAHDAIEAAVEIERHLASRAAYRALLARYHGFHIGFEAARDASPAAADLDPALVPPVSRAGLIAQDLMSLGLTDLDIAALPVARLAYRDRPALLGAIYVIEGSAMGGVLIAKLAADRLGLAPEAGTAFFAGDGREPARRWRETAAALDRAANPDDAAGALEAAHATFAAMSVWLAPDRAFAPSPARGPGATPALAPAA